MYKFRLENGAELYRNRNVLKPIKETMKEEKVNHHSPIDSKKEDSENVNVKYYIELENSDSEENIDVWERWKC